MNTDTDPTIDQKKLLSDIDDLTRINESLKSELESEREKNFNEISAFTDERSIFHAERAELFMDLNLLLAEKNKLEATNEQLTDRLQKSQAYTNQISADYDSLREYMVHGLVQNAIDNVVAQQNKPVVAQRTGWNSWKGYLFRGIAFHEFASLAKNEDIIFPSPMLRLKQTFLGNKEAPQLLELSSISEMKKETSVESLLPVSAEKIYDCAVEVCVHNSVTLPLPFNCTFTILNLFS